MRAWVGEMPRVPVVDGVRPGWLDRHAPVVALALFAASAVLALPMVGAQGIWFDEAVTLQNGQQPFDLLRNLDADATPPLYALLVRAWMLLFGVSLESARTLSIAASAASTALLFLVGRRFVGARAGLFAALLLATSRLQLFLAHEARPYAVVVLLCIASFAALLALLESPSWKRAVVLGLLDAALLYTHYVAVFALVAQGIGAYLHGPRERRVVLAFASSQALAGLLFLPLVAYLVTIWPLPMAGWLAAPTPRGFVVELGKLVGDEPLLGVELLLLAGALAWIARPGLRARRFSAPSAVLLASWALVPLLGAYAASFVEPMFLARYLLYAAPGLFLLLGYVLAAAPAPAAAQTLVVTLVAAWSLWLATTQPIVRPGWREAAELVRAANARGAVAIVVPAHTLLPFGYHFAPDAFRDAERLPERLRDERVFGLPDAAALDGVPPAPGRELVVVLAGPYAAYDAPVTRSLARRGFALRARDELQGLVVLRYAGVAGWNADGRAG